MEQEQRLVAHRVVADRYVRPNELLLFQKFKKNEDWRILLFPKGNQLSAYHRTLVIDALLLVRASLVNRVDESKLEEGVKKSFSKEDDCALFKNAYQLPAQYGIRVFKTRGKNSEIFDCVNQIVGNPDRKIQGIRNRCFHDDVNVTYGFIECLRDLWTLDEFVWHFGLDECRKGLHEMMKSNLE